LGGEKKIGEQKKTIFPPKATASSIGFSQGPPLELQIESDFHLARGRAGTIRRNPSPRNPLKETEYEKKKILRKKPPPPWEGGSLPLFFHARDTRASLYLILFWEKKKKWEKPAE